MKRIKKEVKDQELKNTTAMIHQDGKLLPALIGKEIVHRLPIIITNNDIEKILNVPSLPQSTEKARAEVIFEILLEQDLEDKIQACCFDTTPSNRGRFNGASKSNGKKSLIFFIDGIFLKL